MSGARGGQSFGIRLSLDGADAVEGGLRRVQATAGTVSTAIATLGENTGRSMQLLDRGSQAAGQALQRLGGDFAALAPLVEGSASAVGRLVTGLGAGAGLLGVMGAVGAAVAAAVALYQNWDTVSRATGTAIDYLSGRVRESTTAIPASNAALREFIRLGETAAQAGNRRFIEGQLQQATAAEGRLPGARAALESAERALEAARAGLSPAQAEQFRTGRGAFGDLSAEQQAEQQRQLAEVARRRADDPRVQARIRQAEEDVFQAQARDVPDTGGGAAARGGGGGRTAVQQASDAERLAEAIIRQGEAAERANDPIAALSQQVEDLTLRWQNGEISTERYNEALDAAEQAFARLDERARDTADTLAQSSKDIQFAARGAGQALGGAFEDLIFNGEKAGDVMRSLERDLLRLGTRLLITQPIEQAFSGLFGGGTGGSGGGSGGGGIASLIAQGVQFASSFFHDGGTVGTSGRMGPMMPAAVWAGAPRYHMGGIIGPDEVPAILRRGEVVRTPEQEAALGRRMGGITVNINGVTDANSFRNSQGQIAGRLAAALARTGRNR